MKTSGPRFVNKQLLLSKEWMEIPLKSYHDGAVVVGDFFEELSSVVFHSTYRLCTDGTADICPDLFSTNGKEVIESKASSKRSGRQYLLFLHQLEMYGKYIKEQQKVVNYVFWVYDVGQKVGDFKTRDQLRKGLSQGVVSASVVPHDIVMEMVAPKRVEGGSDRYPPFCRLRYPDIKKLAVTKTVRLKNIGTYEEVVNEFDVFFCKRSNGGEDGS